MRAWISAAFDRLEAFLDAQREQLPLWGVIGFGLGIGLWFWLGAPPQWEAILCLAGSATLAGRALVPGRTGQALFWLGITVAAGLSLVWARSEWVAAPRLAKPQVTAFAATVVKAEPRVADGKLRLTLAPHDAALPPLVRVSLDLPAAPPGLNDGAEIRLRARLAPPPPMALPGSHDFARDAWFMGLGAVGKALGDVSIVRAAPPSGLDGLRNRLDIHIQQSLPGSAGTIATAFVSGNQNAISQDDANAMRRSGLAHLLSVSGLHIAAVVAATMFLSLRLLSLSERLALRFNLVLVSAGCAAAAGIGYTLLTGAQVPTVRSCIAALLVLAGLALGREALSLRLVAAGAVVVLLISPESLVGPSFQMSFASVATIIALHGFGPVNRFLARREEGMLRRFGRHFASLIFTGLAVEFALMPFALYHFHRAGFYGVIANLVAIPLTTFVTMPLEALALALDPLGLGHPLWVATGWSLDLLLAVAHRVASAPGAVAMLPTMPTAAFAAMVLGGLWCCLWRGRVRAYGLLPVAAGALAAILAPTPDLLVTGDGRHVALVQADGAPLMLRERSGDFTRSLMAESAGFDGDTGWIEDRADAQCSADSCRFAVQRSGRAWQVLAFRSSYLPDWRQTVVACAAADIVVADRRLPRACTPRWLKLDAPALRDSGGLSIMLGPTPAIATVSERVRQHPWAA
ncbi:MAG: ComEC/Rec2 family competence protein [Sphingomicrobium sp.]|nr:ComEC/Rec2 family competence protein [Sphingomonadales bacterium]